MNKPARMTRRGWATMVAAAVPLAAQVTATPQTTPPQPTAGANTPEQRVAKAAADVRKVSDRLAETEVPMQVEPAFNFHA